jgi:hypothetical protein
MQAFGRTARKGNRGTGEYIILNPYEIIQLLHHQLIVEITSHVVELRYFTKENRELKF